jgi:hypothetical protein
MIKTIDSERLKIELLGKQRWEDEGGQMIEDNDSSPDQIFVQPAPIHARRRVTSLRWNERFVIQPFHRSNGIFLIRQKPAVKTG